MSKTSAFLTPVFAMVMILASCSKALDHSHAVAGTTFSSAEIVNAAIGSGQSYALSFVPSAAINIYQQAAHFQVSATQLNNETGQVTYTYVPATGYSGDDAVTLTKIITSQGNSTGGCHSGNHGNTSNTVSTTSFVTINIKVTP